MAANTSGATPASSSAAVVGSQFVLPFPVDLFFTSEAPGMKKGNLVAFDLNGKLVFQVHHKHGRIISDASGNPLISMKDKFGSIHNRKQMFRGDSKEKEDLLFTVKDSSSFQFHEKRDVYLANNRNEDVCDYKIIGKYRKGTVTVYKGESSYVVAQMNKVEETNLQLGKHGFRVSVSPDTDFAFIASLFFLLHQLEVETSSAATTHAGLIHAGNHAGSIAGDFSSSTTGDCSAASAGATASSAGGGCGC